MELSAYLAFVLLAAAQVATPGPSTLFLVSNALVHGRARALVALGGDLAAIALLASLSAVGVAQVLAASPSVFMALRIGGALYMLWLGWTYLRPQKTSPKAGASTDTRTSGRDLWVRSFAVGLSNPKAILFFAAFFPQFVPPGGSPAMLMALVATFVVVKLLVLGAYALGAHQMSRVLRSPSRARAGRVMTGLLFVGFAILMLAAAVG